MRCVFRNSALFFCAAVFAYATAWAASAQTIAEWSETAPARSEQMSVTFDGRVLTFKRVTTNKRYPAGTAVMFSVDLADVSKLEKGTFQEAGYPSAILIKVNLKPGKTAKNTAQETGKPPVKLPPLEEGFNISFTQSKAALRDETYEKLAKLIRH